MGKGSAIQWTDDTDNIIVVEGGGWWCRKMSDGCKNCYAASLNQNSFYGGNKLAYSGTPPKLTLRRDLLDGWARQTRARLHFVASMTDVFGEWVSREWHFATLDAMAAAPRQIFQLLTKRPKIMAEAMRAWLDSRGLDNLPVNIWPGVSVENQETADARLDDLNAMHVFAAYLWVSYEPAIGPVNWKRWRHYLSQIISGGESGPGARPSHPDWHRATRDWCAENDVAYFFKQWGEYLFLDQCGAAGVKLPLVDAMNYAQTGAPIRVGKHASGRKLDGREHSDFPLCYHPALHERPMLHQTEAKT